MARKSIHIATTLEQEILSGKFADGQSIDEMAIAERFESSRTPVREALIRLAANGLVTLEAGRGAIVNAVSVERMFETYEVLAELMGFAAELTTRRITPLSAAQLQALHLEMSDFVDKEHRDDYQKLDHKFHDLILQGCGNKVLIEEVGRCNRTINSLRRASIEAHESLDEMYGEHDRIIKAICDGDAQEARRAVKAHLQLRGQGATKLLQVLRISQKSGDLDLTG